MHKTDLEIASNASKKHINDIAASINIPEEALIVYGNDKAKINYDYLDTCKDKKNGKLILVTAISPTPAGEGKQLLVLVWLMGLCHIGKKAMICLESLVLGPCFGMKGGAAGGGYAQVVPMTDINLHFTGDFHAIGAAHNLLISTSR
jgi:formate--tetrahydrofolate ligase